MAGACNEWCLQKLLFNPVFLDQSMNSVQVQEHKECLISGTVPLKRLKRYEKTFLVKSPVGFVFCSRIPTEEELVNHYKGYSRDESISSLTIKRYHELLDGFEKYRKTGKILDIGCGVGSFLVEAKKRGWEVYGTEFTDEAIEKCEMGGINMQKGKLDTSWYSDEQFDIVTSFEVIEHINNPREEIKGINKILRKGGLLYITTPNFNAFERYILKDKYTEIIQYPEHLSYYTKRTLNYLLRNNGFKKIKITTSGISLTRIKIGLSIGREKFGSADSTDQALRETLDGSKVMRLAKSTLNSLLDTMGIGNALKAWYVKE